MLDSRCRGGHRLSSMLSAKLNLCKQTGLRGLLANSASTVPKGSIPARRFSTMTFDAFVSYSNRDKATADAACAALEAAGIRCWIAPRDVVPGSDWGSSIIAAIDRCRAMVLIFSSSANESPQIRNEVVQAVNRSVPVIPVRIENVEPTKALAYHMGAVHWLDALTPPLEQHLQRLAESVRALLNADKAADKQ